MLIVVLYKTLRVFHRHVQKRFPPRQSGFSKMCTHVRRPWIRRSINARKHKKYAARERETQVLQSRFTVDKQDTLNC